MMRERGNFVVRCQCRGLGREGGRASKRKPHKSLEPRVFLEERCQFSDKTDLPICCLKSACGHTYLDAVKQDSRCGIVWHMETRVILMQGISDLMHIHLCKSREHNENFHKARNSPNINKDAMKKTIIQFQIGFISTSS